MIDHQEISVPRLGRLVCVEATDKPQRALVLLHGRGATAESMLPIVSRLAIPRDVVTVLPQAEGNSWYPTRFTAPVHFNQPFLDESIKRLSDCAEYLRLDFGIEPQSVALGGFSQGACLAAEFLKRHPERYLGAALWSGGLIGEDQDVAHDYKGSLAGTPVYIGCDRNDFHIPAARVVATADYFRQHDGQVDAVFYDGLGHTIHPDGLEFLRGCF